MKLLFQTLAAHRQNYKGFLLLYLFLVLAVSVASVVATRLTGDIAEAALEFDTTAIFQFLGTITAITLVRVIASGVSALMLGRFAGHAGYRFRDNFAKYFTGQPFAKIENINTGESLSVFSNDLPHAIELVSGGGIRMLGDFIILIVTFIYMLTLNVPLTLIFFASFPVLVVMQVLIAKPIQKKQAARLKAQADFVAIANDSLQNTSTIAAYSLENVINKRCQDAYANIISTFRAHILAFLPLILFGSAASIAPMIIIIVIAAGRVINGSLSIAEYVAFISLAGVAGSWLQMLAQRQNQVQTHAAGAKRLMDALEGEDENITKGNIINPKGEVALAANGLTFAYPAVAANEMVQPTLNDITFQIKKGSRVAFVGGSGSGKSTVLKILLGLYAPNSGSVDVFGAGISESSLESLRDTFAYVPQDSFLFPESIGANITGEERPSDIPRLEQACKDAGILEFIQSLPDKFDSVLNESAENVSGGQKQRIALARAFYRNAPIILFDEATSALDPATEAAILKSFDTLAQDKTVVMVAHRTSAIDFCDTIIVMDNGKIAATGTHEELLNSSAIYKKLSHVKRDGERSQCSLSLMRDGKRSQSSLSLMQDGERSQSSLSQMEVLS